MDRAELAWSFPTRKVTVLSLRCQPTLGRRSADFGSGEKGFTSRRIVFSTRRVDFSTRRVVRNSRRVVSGGLLLCQEDEGRVGDTYSQM